jgi:hypothetical protein
MHEAFVLQTALLQQRQFVRAMSATARRFIGQSPARSALIRSPTAI